MPGKTVKRTYRRTNTVTDDHFYHCQQAWASSNAVGKVCHKTNYRADLLEQLTCTAIKTVAKHPELLRTAIAVYRQNYPTKNTTDEISYLQKRLQEIDRKEKATVEAQIASVMAGAGPHAFIPVLRELTEQRESLTLRLAQVQAIQEGMGRGQTEEAEIVRAVLADVDEALDATEIEPIELRNLLTQIIDRVTPYQDEKGAIGVRVDLKSPSSRSTRRMPGYQPVSMISIFATIRSVSVEVIA
jgi:hypothetical protein